MPYKQYSMGTFYICNIIMCMFPLVYHKLLSIGTRAQNYSCPLPNNLVDEHISILVLSKVVYVVCGLQPLTLRNKET